MQARDGQSFPDPEGYKILRDTLPEHSGSGEQVAFIDIEADADRLCRAGLHNPSLNLGLTFTFRKSELPWLTNWQHLGRGEYVTAIEPGTNPPIGQAMARETNTLIFIEPGASKTYHLTLDINA